MKRNEMKRNEIQAPKRTLPSVIETNLSSIITECILPLSIGTLKESNQRERRYLRLGS